MATPTRVGRAERRLGALTLIPLLLIGRAQPVLAGALERAMLGKAAVVDLTHVVNDHPVPSGQEPPRSDLPPAGQLLTRLEVPAAAGKRYLSVAEISPRDLLVQAVVVDIAEKVAGFANYLATVDDLRAWERRNGRIPKRTLVLLHTGWSKRWSEPVRYLNLDAQGISRVPGFSAAALAFLANDRDVRGVGLDALSPEGPLGDEAHAALLAGRFQIENLTNLDRLPTKGIKLVIMPLRIEGGSAPARVIAILP